MSNAANQNRNYNFQFDASQVAPQGILDPIPAGKYLVAITESNYQPTEDGNAMRWGIELTVQDGEFKGRKIFDGLNLQSKTSQQNQDISQAQLSAICHAIQVIRFTDLRELHNKQFIAKISLEPSRTDQNTGKTYEPQNRFKGAQPVSGGGASNAPAGGPVAGGAPKPNWATGGAPAGGPPAGGGFPGGPAFPGAAPGAPAGPTPFAPAAPAPAPVKHWYLYHGDANNIPKVLESEIIARFATLPANAQVASVNPDGGCANDWKTLAAAGIRPQPAAPASPAPFAPAAPAAVAPAAATAPGAPVAPPWGR